MTRKSSLHLPPRNRWTRRNRCCRTSSRWHRNFCMIKWTCKSVPCMPCRCTATPKLSPKVCAHYSAGLYSSVTHHCHPPLYLNCIAFQNCLQACCCATLSTCMIWRSSKRNLSWHGRKTLPTNTQEKEKPCFR